LLVVARREWFWLGAVLVAALGIRLLYVFTAGIEIGPRLQYDMSFYHAAGRSLAKGRGLTFFGVPSAMWPPGYPLMIAAAYRVSDAPLVAVQVWQAVLGTLTCLITFLIGRRLFSPAHGLAAAALLAFSPEVISFTPLVLTEVLYTTMFAGLVLLFVRWNADPTCGNGRWASYGMLVGMAALVRGIALLFPLVLGAVWLSMRVPLRTTMGRLVAVGAGLLLTLTPWAVRNQLVLGSPVFVSTEIGEVLFVAHSPVATGGLTTWEGVADWAAMERHSARVRAARVPVDHLPPAEREVHRNREETWRAIRRFFADPGRELELVIPRLRFLYRHGHAAYVWGRRVSEDGRERQPLYDAQLDRVLLGVADWYFYALLAFGLLGVPWAWSRERSSSRSSSASAPLKPAATMAMRSSCSWNSGTPSVRSRIGSRLGCA
jgi:4-amino-4-deoxy-L-arabinose transferase-like glycosyltransferase